MQRQGWGGIPGTFAEMNMKPIIWTSLFWILVLIALLFGNRSADRAQWANTKSDGKA